MKGARLIRIGSRATLGLLLCGIAVGSRVEAPAAQSPGELSVEFELPPEVTRSGPTQLLVGYFPENAPADAEPLFSYTATSRRPARNGRMRVALRGWKGEYRGPLVVRLRLVTSKGHSAWSEPSDAVPAERIAALLSADRAEDRASGRNRDRALIARVAERLEKDEKLRNELHERFPDLEDVQAAADGYATLENFVAALLLSEKFDIPFEDLKPLTTPRQRDVVEEALETLRPDLDGAAEATAALRQARRFLRQAR